MEKTIENIKESINQKLTDLQTFAGKLDQKFEGGKTEAEQEFEKQKHKLKEWTDSAKSRVEELEKEGSESLTDLRTKIDELKVQAALGKAESKEVLQEQQKNLKSKLHEVQNLFKKIIK